MIFKVKFGQNLRDTNDNIDAVPEFVGVSDKVLRYVFLMFDYDSPYSRLPYDIKKEQVLINIDYTNSGSIASFFSRNKEKIEICTKKLQEIQYDEQYEGLQSCKTQLRAWDKLLRNEEKTEKEEALAFKIFDKYPQLMEKVSEMEKIVGYREKYEKESDVSDKSALERYMEKRKAK